jgi:hypothetical protein
MGFDANLGERGLKSWAKAGSTTARKWCIGFIVKIHEITVCGFNL